MAIYTISKIIVSSYNAKHSDGGGFVNSTTEN